MFFSPICEHAIRALIFLSGQPQGKAIHVKVISKEANVPAPFLSKILLQLKHNKMVVSVKGPGGGYYLARSPASVKVREIIRIFSNQKVTACLLGLDDCSDEHPCPMHSEWKKFKQDIEKKINSLTLDTLFEKVKEKKAHLMGISQRN